MDELSQSNHRGAVVIHVLMEWWSRHVSLVGLRALPRSELDCHDFTGVLRLRTQTHVSCHFKDFELVS
ncbi:hypothetical protein F2Q70_00030378 [Brassica cretica]|uniref:Uncharacterized protein n=1 Tax=Brassica cretica TaxID=69181 RepID=A0A8S9FHN8_BRACR|nr:hypothetical protein F2Q70_00030378 [Brassica cretica]